MSLGNLIMSHEYKKLLDILTSDNQEHDNQGMEIDEEEIVPLKGMIGTFVLRKKGVETTPIMLEDGMFIGNMILPQVNTMSTTGIVAFDAGAGVHYVICEKDMSLPDKSHILEAFGLDSERTIFVKQSINPKKNKNIQKQE